MVDSQGKFLQIMIQSLALLKLKKKKSPLSKLKYRPDYPPPHPGKLNF